MLYVRLFSRHIPPAVKPWCAYLRPYVKREARGTKNSWNVVTCKLMTDKRGNTYVDVYWNDVCVLGCKFSVWLNDECMVEGKTGDYVTKDCFLDFKLSLCCECCILSFVRIPGIWIFCANILEHCLFHLLGSFKQETLFEWLSEEEQTWVFRNIGTKNLDARESHKRRNTARIAMSSCVCCYTPIRKESWKLGINSTKHIIVQLMHTNYKSVDN